MFEMIEFWVAKHLVETFLYLIVYILTIILCCLFFID